VLRLLTSVLLSLPAGWFTGLTPQLVDETFITDLEQRYEQGQHLHTRDCSSTRASLSSASCYHAPAAYPAARAVERIAGAAAAATGAQCRSLGAAGANSMAAAAAAAGGLAGAGGRICLRLHVLARGLQELRQAGGDSVGVCLERLRDTVEKMRRNKEVAAADDEVRLHCNTRELEEHKPACPRMCLQVPDCYAPQVLHTVVAGAAIRAVGFHRSCIQLLVCGWRQLLLQTTDRQLHDVACRKLRVKGCAWCARAEQHG
jgi:hypothetical protein